jgi:hypothetical protein
MLTSNLKPILTADVATGKSTSGKSPGDPREPGFADQYDFGDQSLIKEINKQNYDI